MDVRASEISEILKKQISEFEADTELSETGQVVSVGDGIATVYGLENIQAGEMVEFSNGMKGMALNLASDNVGVAGVRFLVDGNQNHEKARGALVYGQSITDKCMSWERTEPLFEVLAGAVRERRGR